MAIYEEWLLKAKRDLDTAKALLEKSYFDTAMPEGVYDRYSKEPLFIGSLEEENINLILFETDIEKITRWIKR
jgi:hypothetical protein